MAEPIANLIVPEVFNPYFLELTAEKTRVLLPMVNQDNQFASKFRNSGGRTIEMPFFKDLDGDPDELGVGNKINVERIDSDQDRARRHMLGKGWTTNDLEAELTAEDPASAIAGRVADYWSRQYQQYLFHSLEGVFADNEDNDSGDLIHNVSDEDFDNADEQSDHVLKRKTIAVAKNKIGDSGKTLTTIAVHSDVYTDLQIRDEIREERDSEANLEFESFAGKKLVVDDGLPTEDGSTSGTKYTSYLFGENSVGFAQGMAKVPSEVDRDAEMSEDRLFTRTHFMIHPRGFRWEEESVAGNTPTVSEIKDGDNWNRVYERKNTRIVKIVSNVILDG